MATQALVGTAGGKAGSVELDPAVFEAPVKPHLFHAEVRRQARVRVLPELRAAALELRNTLPPHALPPVAAA